MLKETQRLIVPRDKFHISPSMPDHQVRPELMRPVEVLRHTFVRLSLSTPRVPSAL
jgi:hypothetical protein